jgi:hypothetical protein
MIVGVLREIGCEEYTGIIEYEEGNSTADYYIGIGKETNPLNDSSSNHGR